VQSIRVCGAATPAGVVRCILFLKRLFFFHLLGRFRETPSAMSGRAKASDTDALQFL
jgi:hypothetical protein